MGVGESLCLQRCRRMCELVLTFILLWIMSGDLRNCFKAMGRNVKNSSQSALKEFLSGVTVLMEMQSD